MTVEEYVKQREIVAAIRPVECGACGSAGMWHGNGWYPRGVVWSGGTAQALEVRRLECQDCGHTTSLLPDFLHRYRHYGLEVIEQVVSARVDERASWSKLEERHSRDGAPSLRTLGGDRRGYDQLDRRILENLFCAARQRRLGKGFGERRQQIGLRRVIRDELRVRVEQSIHLPVDVTVIDADDGEMDYIRVPARQTSLCTGISMLIRE